MACAKNCDQVVVLPIFYDVDPSHLRHQKDGYGKALQATAKGRKHLLNDWKIALTEAATMIGWDAKNVG
ncbi:TMV resistance protein N-like, partial [Trifolium medium]|nr:TMV resistance protein N-like [Trifolium medium]